MHRSILLLCFFALLHVAYNQCNFVGSNPYYSIPLSEGNGTVIRESVSGSTYSPIMSGSAPSWTRRAPPGYSASLTLDGTNTYYSIPQGSFGCSSNFTITLWAKLSASANTSIGYTIIKGPCGTSIEFSNKQFTFTYGATTILSTVASGVLFDQWYYITATSDFTNLINYLYVNSVLQSNSSFTSSNSASDFKIGASGSGKFFSGSLNAIQIYKSLLNQTSVYNAYTQSDNTCNGVGTCTSNTCNCPTGYSGPTCQYFACNSTMNSNSSVCSSVGACIAPGNCTCPTGYSGSQCEIYACYSVRSNSIGTCSAVISDLRCESWTCAGTMNNDTNVCSGRGTCLSPTGVKTYPMVGPAQAGAIYFSDYQLLGAVDTFQFWGGSWQDSLQWSSSEANYNSPRYYTNGGGMNYLKLPPGDFVSNINVYLYSSILLCIEFMSARNVTYSPTGNCRDLGYGVSRITLGASEYLIGFFGYWSPNGFVGVNQVGFYTKMPGTGCQCPTGYYGLACNLYTCYGTINNDPNVCSTKGFCGAIDNCTCNAGYYGQRCEAYNCYGTLYNDTQVCSGHGSCGTPDNCACNAGYYGQRCEAYMCGGVLFNSSSVCSGAGTCVSPDKCVCNNSTLYGQVCQFSYNNLPINAFSTKYNLAPFNSYSYNLGYDFSVNQPTTITQVGIYSNCETFQQNNYLTLYDSSTAMLNRWVINNASSLSKILLTKFVVRDIEPYILYPNTVYTLFMFVGDSCGGTFGAASSVPDFTILKPTGASYINYIQTRYDFGGGLNTYGGITEQSQNQIASATFSFIPFNNTIISCYGILSNSSSVCGGVGTCNSNGTCTCPSNYAGHMCQVCTAHV
ncbi:hypothetical protein AKO1_008082 [Acrasis kona]|uniref:EGF-like domain-containing protein n=1 Tax=Acrasis kona TaxID=1008807 RepID=A0AAW2YPF9_9EUKA